MKWYRKLYIGENAKKDKYKVFGHIRKNRFCADTLLITLAIFWIYIRLICFYNHILRIKM